MDDVVQGNRTPLQELLANKHVSALQKYQEMAVGERGIVALLRYEFFMCCLAGTPGAAGLWLRSRLYGYFLGRVGQGIIIGRNVTIRHPKRISLGNNVVIDDGCVLDAKGQGETGIVVGNNVILGRNTILSCKGGTIVIGNNTNISIHCAIFSESSVRIGDNVLFAAYCYIVAGGNHGIDRTDVAIIQQDAFSKGGVTIEDNAWLGAGVKVLDGVTIGHDAVAGAGAVVLRDIAPFTIAVGIPAKTLKDRRSPAKPPPDVSAPH